MIKLEVACATPDITAIITNAFSRNIFFMS